MSKVFVRKLRVVGRSLYVYIVFLYSCIYYSNMSAKEKILKSAIELFSLKGFDGVSIREIADHAQVHFASIRYHFGDKEDLYKACIELHGESRLNVAQKFLGEMPQSAEDAKLRLSFALNESFQIHAENPFLSKLVLQEIETSAGKYDITLRNTMVAMTDVYSDFLKRCQKNGYLKLEPDATFMTLSMMGIVHHYMRTENVRERLLAHQTLSNKAFREKIVGNIIKLYFE